MPGLVETGLRLLRQLLGETAGTPAPLPGLPTALRGAAAVAIAEACVAEVAGLGGGAPADLLTQAWEAERRREGLNLLGGALSEVVAPTSRGTLASAVGMALSGARATAFLSGPNLAGQQDLLATAAGRHLPLVIHGVSRALSGHAGARGSGHEAWHAIADAGLIQLFARNVQEAVDFALVGRRVAETALRPVLVFMDDERTAAVTQDVLMPGADLVRRYLGAPGDRIDCPTPAQRMLFGETRRRVPRWHDLERPVLHGAIQGRGVWSLGAAGCRPFSAQGLLPILEAAFADFATLTGRRYGLLRAHRVEDAEVVLVAQGAGAEIVETVVEHLRARGKRKVGCICLLGLRPFPDAALVSALQGCPRVAVLERTDSLLAEDPPLSRELRAAFARAVENHRHGSETHPGLPAVAAERVPRLHAAVYGLGGYPLRAGDIAALVDEVRAGGRSLVYLGIDFQRKDSRYPKRKVLLDRLAREWPAAQELGLVGPVDLDVRPAGAVTIAVHRVGGAPGGALGAALGRALQATLGGCVRGRAGQSWERWQAPCVDRVVFAPTPVDPGNSGPVDLALVMALSARSAADPLADVRAGGAVLVAAPSDAAPLLPQPIWRRLEERGVLVVAVPCPAGPEEPAFKEEALAVALRLLGERGLALPSRKKLLAARSLLLDGLEPEAFQARIAAFEAGLDRELTPVACPLAAPAAGLPQSVPMAVRHFHRADGTYDSLPRFWDQVGILFRDGQTDELVPDPFLATSVVPPLTATFNDLTPLRRFFPAWNPAACTGCGRCWSGCPDSAIGPLALPVPALVEGAMGLAAARGASADPLRPLLSKVVQRVGGLLRVTREQPTAFGAVLREAGALVLEKAKLPPDRALPAQAALEAVAATVDDLPIAGTRPFFVEPEERQAGTGEILGLSINPDACKDCGICEAACPEGAMKMEPQTDARVAWARQDWQRWELLPDASGETIARVRGHQGVGPLAAMLLSRTCLLGLSGGDSAEAGSGEKVAVRLVLAAAEYQLQPELQRHIGQVEGLRARLVDALGQRLAQALPTGDPASIALGLRGLRQPEIDLSVLLARVEGQGEHGRVDVAQLRRLADLAGRLQDLRRRLAEGPDGLGRARFSVAIEPGPIASWAGTFPDNPFHVPVVVASSGEGIHLGRGLLEGQLRAVLEDLRLVREARVALERPGEYARAQGELAELGWRGLTREERRLVPPVLVLGHESALTGRNLATLATVLDLDLPVKIVVLADCDLGLTAGSGGAEPDEIGSSWTGSLGEVGLLALGQRRAYVTQCALSEPAQLFEGLTAAFAHVGPALVRVHAPSPRRHGFPVREGLEQSRRAVLSRTFPLFRYDPAREGVFGACLFLDGNPEVTGNWAHDAAGVVRTAADWAATERRFAAELSPVGPTDPEPTPLPAWLELPLHTRHGRTPFVLDPAGRRVAVSARLCAVAEERLRTWRTLQELGGLVTPFTARVREEAERELSARHAAVLADLEARHARELAALRAEVEREMGQRVRESLLRLAGYPQGQGD